MINHPNVHQPWSEWSEDQKLHVAVGYSNFFRWRTRRELMNDFIQHFSKEPNVVLHIAELAHGDRPWEVTDPSNPNHLQLRSTHELFFKENLQKVLIRKSFPASWKYGAAFDGDFHMTRHDWALETIHQLQHYDWVQPFSNYTDVSGKVYGQSHLPTRQNTGFFFNYINNGYRVSPQYHNGIVGPDGRFIPSRTLPEGGCYDSAMRMVSEEPGGEFLRGVGATGGAFAFRRSAYDAVGGLLDRCVLGHADWYMSFQLANVTPPDIHSQKYHPAYKEYVQNWGIHAARLKQNIGYVDGLAIHFFHGSKTRRAYSSRDVIMAEEQFHPYEDLIEDHQGIYQLTPDKPRLRDKLRAYFISRFEDDPNIYPPEKSMV